MSFNNNHITLGNYEEWFVLYMDNELSADQKEMVEAFLLLHPQLQEEMDILLSTKLPVEDIAFFGKQGLSAEAMKLNTVDDSLLLYLDNELSVDERKTVEEKLAVNKDLRLQYEILLKTKLDTTEVMPHPNKTELYRHAGKVVFFPVWMRVAVAVVLVLFASLFFVLNRGNKTTVSPTEVATKVDSKEEKKTTSPENNSVPVNNSPNTILQQQFTASLKTEGQHKTRVEAKTKLTVVQPQKQTISEDIAERKQPIERLIVPGVDPTKTNLPTLAIQPTISLNNSTAKLAVTSHIVDTLKQYDYPDVATVMEGKSRRTPAKGFLRKVSRFIERRTGIGTVNADNELLVGAVALKLN